MQSSTCLGRREHALRVLLVIPGAQYASSYIFSKRQAAMLALANVDVRVFSLSSRTSIPALLRELFRMRKEIRDFRPQVIHAQYGTMTAFFAGISSTLPLVVTFRGSDLNPEPHRNPIRVAFAHALSQIAALRATRTICVSAELRKRLWWRKKRSKVIVGGVNLELFNPICRTEARAALGWPTQARIVLFNAGKQPKAKRLDLAEAALAEARKLRSDVQLYPLFGDVPPDSMPLYLSAADCLLVTSDWEGSPTVVKEALACNLPVLSVDVGDVRARLQGVSPSGITGRSAIDIGGALVQILDSEQRSNGREGVAELSEHDEVFLVRAVYDSVLRREKAS